MKKRTNNGRYGVGGNNELISVVLMCVSAFFLLCLVVPIVLGVISEAVRGVVLGLFGLFSYPLFLSLFLLGYALKRNFEVDLSLKNKICIAVAAFCAITILHLATSFMFLEGGFLPYITEVFDSKLTVGGVLFGVIVYGLQSSLTVPFTFVLLGALLLGSVLFLVDAFKLLKNRNVSPPLQSPASIKIGDDYIINQVPNNRPPFFKVKPSDSHEQGKIGQNVKNNSEEVQQPPPTGAAYLNNNKNGCSDNGELSDEEKKRRENSLKMLFPDRDKKTEYTGFTGASSGGGNSSGGSSYGGGGSYGSYSSPLDRIAPSCEERQDDDVVSSEPPEKNRPTVRTQPPMVYDSQFPVNNGLPNMAMPDPKPREKVEGPICDGDAESDRIKAEQRKEEEKQGRYDFGDRGAPVKEFLPIEKKEPEPPVQPPIINGDSIGETKKTPEQAQKPLSRQSVGFSAPDSSEPAEKDSIKESAPAPEEIKSYPIFNGESQASELRRLIAEDKNIRRNPPVTDSFTETSGETKSTFADSPAENEPDSDRYDDSLYLKDESADFSDDFSDDNEFKKDEPPAEERSEGTQLTISDELLDMTERSFDVETDSTGYYETTSEAERTVEKRRTSGKGSSRTPLPAIVGSKQLSIDDIAQPPQPPRPSVPKKRKLGKYIPPIVDLLTERSDDFSKYSGDTDECSRIIENVFKNANYDAKVTAVHCGPAATSYEIALPNGGSVKNVENLNSDLKFNLACHGEIRMEIPVPGKRAIGIEVPNSGVAKVALYDMISSEDFNKSEARFPICIGKDIEGKNVFYALENHAHLLVAGGSGSGKSVGLNAMLISLLYKASPEDVRIILMDPKCVEFNVYGGLPHLLLKDIISEPSRIVRALKWAVDEMNRRYSLMGQYRARKLDEFNAGSQVKNGDEEKLPRIVIMIDEVGDLMVSAQRKEVESLLVALGQKARAAGIHLILATQRPSVDVITGTIKVNFLNRIAFSVSNGSDSRVILDQTGAETLLGNGDMLYFPDGARQAKRVQGAFISTVETARVIEFVKEHNVQDFDEELESLIMKEETISDEDGASLDRASNASVDAELEADEKDILRQLFVAKQTNTSTSSLQRKFRFGYNRAAMIMDDLEAKGFVGPLENNKPRALLITPEKFYAVFGEEL